MPRPALVVVLGAGSIGCYVGGALSAAGVPVHLLTRPSMLQHLQRYGLHLSDLHGWQHSVAAGLGMGDDPAVLAQADLIVLTVKAGASLIAAADISRHARPGTPVLCLQNGVRSAERLRAVLPHWPLIAGMVPFNVAQLGEGRFHRGTAGELMAQAHPALGAWLAAFATAGVPVQTVADLQPILWGKLLLNLNNAVNALSGLPLQMQLAQRGYRRVLARLQVEALQVLERAGISPARAVRVSPRLLPWVLRLPDAWFRMLARRMLAIDPQARSSMWEDLERGRGTEIAVLNGEIVALGRELGVPTPANARIVALIEAAESGGRRDYTARELLAALAAPLKVP